MATTANVTGIQVKGIPNIKIAIDNYRKAVKKKCDISAKASVVSNAIQGEASEASLKALAAAIDAKMQQLIKQIDQYDELLDSMKGNYASNDANNDSFNSVAKKINEA